MLVFQLKPLLHARGIDSPLKFLVKAGLTYHTANYILRDKHKEIKYKYLEKICKALCCTPNDLFVYVPTENESIAENHPLQSLKPKELPTNIKNLLHKVKLEDLDKIAEFLRKQING